jgi:hypothetical protein
VLNANYTVDQAIGRVVVDLEEVKDRGLSGYASWFKLEPQGRVQASIRFSEDLEPYTPEPLFCPREEFPIEDDYASDSD